jgi:hypothetical protein
VSDFAALPPLGEMARSPETWCDEPITWYPPDSAVGFALACHLGKSHTNDHVSILGSDDHDPPITIELRWSES